MSMPALWSASEIAAATGGKAAGDFMANGVSIDSRTIRPGDLFVAIEGPNFDGHDFVAAAVDAGAAGAIVARWVKGQFRTKLIQVNDTLAALNDLGRAARGRTRARILAVTGSVGKTGTKEMLVRALGRHGASFASPGNLNNQWGAPLSLARLPRLAEYGIFELGMNHAGEISELSRLVRPEIAIITWVAATHLEFFPSVAAIAEAKAEIFDGMKAGGTAILPRDNDHFDGLAERARARGARILSFGEHASADCRLIACDVIARGNEVVAELRGRRIEYRMGSFGRHQAINSLAVLAALEALGLAIEPALAALAEIESLPGRGKREKVLLASGEIDLIDEAYNASPASMRAALSVLGSLPSPKGARRVAVLGDMRELGADARDFHRELAEDLAQAGVDLAFLVGPLMQSLRDALPISIKCVHALDSASMTAPLMAALRAGDVVLVKGSLGTRLAPLVEAIRAMGRALGEDQLGFPRGNGNSRGLGHAL